MGRIQKLAAINVIAVIIGAGIPAMAAQDDYYTHNRGGMQHQTARRGDGEWRDNENRGFRNERRVDRDRRNYDRRDYDRRNYDRRAYGRDYQDGRGYGYGFATGPVYETVPAYVGPAYEDGYYYDDTYNGRRRHERCR